MVLARVFDLQPGNIILFLEPLHGVDYEVEGTNGLVISVEQIREMTNRVKSLWKLMFVSEEGQVRSVFLDGFEYFELRTIFR